MKEIGMMLVCVFSLMIILTTSFIFAESTNTIRLITDSKMCLAKVDLCVMVKKLHMAPLKQIDAGVGALDVACKPDYLLVLKASNYMPACVNPSNEQILVKRGWALSQDDITKLRMKYEPEGDVENINTKTPQKYDPQINPDDFVSGVDNPFFTLTPGITFIYESETDEGKERDEMKVTNNTKAILGVTTIEVWDRVWLDDELIEETLDWYAQDISGNVWYFGEDSKEYDGGKITGTKGSWEAGIDEAKPGIIMQSDPQVGEPYRQEYYKGVAEDMAQVVSTDEKVDVPYGSFEGCVKTKDWNPLDQSKIEFKYYCPDVGGVTLETEHLGSARVELVDIVVE